MLWWRHQMETFSTLLALWAGNSPVTGEFPTQRPVTRSFDVFFDPHLNKQLSKQSWSWWFDTASRPLLCHLNANGTIYSWDMAWHPEGGNICCTKAWIKTKINKTATRSFEVFIDLCLTKRLSKKWWGWWFETPSCPLWRHRNVQLHWRWGYDK